MDILFQSDFEMQVHSKLTNMLKILESKDTTGRNKDLDRINDLIKVCKTTFNVILI